MTGYLFKANVRTEAGFLLINDGMGVLNPVKINK